MRRSIRNKEKQETEKCRLKVNLNMTKEKSRLSSVQFLAGCLDLRGGAALKESRGQRKSSHGMNHRMTCEVSNKPIFLNEF